MTKLHTNWEIKPRHLELEEREIFICDCHSLEHQLAIWYDKDDNFLYIEPRLVNYAGRWHFFKRFWRAVLYVFNYKCRFGEFDEMIMKTKDVQALYEYLKNNPQMYDGSFDPNNSTK